MHNVSTTRSRTRQLERAWVSATAAVRYSEVLQMYVGPRLAGSSSGLVRRTPPWEGAPSRVRAVPSLAGPARATRAATSATPVWRRPRCASPPGVSRPPFSVLEVVAMKKITILIDGLRRVRTAAVLLAGGALALATAGVGPAAAQTATSETKELHRRTMMFSGQFTDEPSESAIV